MPSETDLDTFRALHACSAPERWAAFMALAGYLAEHPEQRLGQAVVNVLVHRAGTRDRGFVIMFDDGTYNRGSGFECALHEADRYVSEPDAQVAAENLHGVEGILPAEDLAQPDLFYMTDAAALAQISGGYRDD